jgi:hypothetical protein
MLLSWLQVLGYDVGLQGCEEVRRLTQRNLSFRAMASGFHLQSQPACRDLAFGYKPDVVGVELKSELFQGPISGCAHFQSGLYRLDSSQEIESQDRGVLDEILIGLWSNFLGRVTDLFTPVIDSQPFLHRLGDRGDNLKRDRRGWGPELAPEE